MSNFASCSSSGTAPPVLQRTTSAERLLDLNESQKGNEEFNFQSNSNTQILSEGNSDTNVFSIQERESMQVLQPPLPVNETSPQLPSSSQPSKAKSQQKEAVQPQVGSQDITSGKETSSIDRQVTDVSEDLQSVQFQLEAAINENNESREKQSELLSLELYKQEMHALEDKSNQLSCKYEDEINKRKETASKIQQLAVISEAVEQDMSQISDLLDQVINMVNCYENRSEGRCQELENEDSGENALHNMTCESSELLKKNPKEKLVTLTEELNFQKEDTNISQEEINELQLSKTGIAENLETMQQTIMEKTCFFDEQFKKLKTEKHSAQKENLYSEAGHDGLKEEFAELEEEEKCEVQEIKKRHEECTTLSNNAIALIEEEKRIVLQIEDVNKKVNELRTFLSGNEEAKLSEESIAQDKLTSDCGNYKREYESLRQKMLILKSQRDEYANNIQTLNTETESLEKSGPFLVGDSKDMNDQMDKLEMEVQVKESNNLLNEKRIKSEDELILIAKSNEQLKADIASKQQKVSTLEIGLSDIQNDIATATNGVERYNMEIKKTEEECANRQKELISTVELYQQQLANQIKYIEKKKEEIEVKNKKMEEELEAVTNKKHDADRERVRLQEDISEKKKLLLSLQSENDDMVQTMIKVQGKTCSYDYENEKIQELLREITQLEEEVRDPEVIEAELKTLQTDIKRLKTEKWILQAQNRRLMEEAERENSPVLKLPANLCIPTRKRRVIFYDESSFGEEIRSDILQPRFKPHTATSGEGNELSQGKKDNDSVLKDEKSPSIFPDKKKKKLEIENDIASLVSDW